MAHKFKLAQKVRLVAADLPTRQGSSDGEYEITRLMPEDPSGMVSYRLKSQSGERVAREIELVDTDD